MTSSAANTPTAGDGATAGDESRAYMLRPGEGRGAGGGVAPGWFKAGAAETGGAFNFHFNENRAGPRPGTPLHVHPLDDECLFMLEGELDVICGSRRFRLTPGCFVFLPRGVPHAVRPLSVSRSVAVIAPGVGWERTRLLMAAHAARGMSADEIFRVLPSESGVEYVGPVDWDGSGDSET